jgi:hypothetical protein
MQTPTSEQIKARVSFLNSVASGSVVASVITPAVGLSIGVIGWSDDRTWLIITACAFWFAIAIVFHLLAYRIAGALED